MPHDPHCAVQVSIVHAFREDARVAFPADVRGTVDVGVQCLPVVLPVQAPLYAPAGEDSLFRVRGPVHRHAVAVPEAGFGRIGLLLLNAHELSQDICRKRLGGRSLYAHIQRNESSCCYFCQPWFCLNILSSEPHNVAMFRFGGLPVGIPPPFVSFLQGYIPYPS